MARIYEISAGRKPTREAFNKLTREVIRLGKMKARNGIRLSSTSSGITLIGGNITPTEVTLGIVRWATLIEDATDDDQILASVQSSTTGHTPVAGTLDAGDAVDNGDGTVSIPSTEHGAIAGEKIVIDGTDDYDGEHTLHENTSTDTLVITATFVSETFSITDTFTVEGYGITVYSEMFNTSRSDMALPRFSEDNEIPIVKRMHYNEGTPEERWYLSYNLYGSDDFWQV